MTGFADRLLRWSAQLFQTDAVSVRVKHPDGYDEPHSRGLKGVNKLSHALKCMRLAHGVKISCHSLGMLSAYGRMLRDR
jgi:hypothetical protein